MTSSEHVSEWPGAKGDYWDYYLWNSDLGVKIIQHTTTLECAAGDGSNRAINLDQLKLIDDLIEESCSAGLNEEQLRSRN